MGSRQGLDNGNLAALELAPEIESIGAQEQQAEPRLIGESDEAEVDLGGEDGEEPGLVAAQAAMIDLHPAGRATAEAWGMAQQCQADERIGQGRQHQRAAKRRSDADLALGVSLAEGRCHQGDDALGQRRSEGGEHRSRRCLAQGEATADPFDAVHEELAGDIDRACRDQQ